MVMSGLRLLISSLVAWMSEIGPSGSGHKNHEGAQHSKQQRAKRRHEKFTSRSISTEMPNH